MAKKGKVGRKARATVAKKGASAPTAKAGTIPLKKVCAEFGIDPKRARVKLRRAWRREEDPAVQFHSIGSRWDLTPKEASEVRAILG